VRFIEMGCGTSNEAKKKPNGSNVLPDGKGGTGGPKKDKNAKDGAISHSQFIVDQKGRLDDHYKLEKKNIGEGSYGTVSRATHKSGHNVRAVKSISKAQMKNIERFKQEINIMKIMDHPNIIRLFETFEDNKIIYLVMELCDGGELFDRIIGAGHFTESQAAILMQQIIRAILYMHENNVCHRDLKPENFLFLTKDPIEKAVLKIIDFGLSCWFKEGQVLVTKAGTPYYVAPQVLAGKYDHSSDMWSVGVIMYVLLCGYPPFYGETDSEVLAKVRAGNFSFSNADWKHISTDAKNLIRDLLKMKPRERCCAKTALNHVWIVEKAPKASGGALPKGMVDNLKGFRSQNKLKKAALHVIANQLDESQMSALRSTFLELDTNSDGQLTVAEMKEGISKAGLGEIPELQTIMAEVDADGSGVIDYTEFLAAALDKRVYMKENVIWTAFRVFDRNGDGHISQEELKLVLQDDSVEKVCGDKAIADLLSEIDGNGDGMIDFEEFMAMMKKNET
jgi:calcium-dependent protein kinase